MGRVLILLCLILSCAPKNKNSQLSSGNLESSKTQLDKNLEVILKQSDAWFSPHHQSEQGKKSIKYEVITCCYTIEVYRGFNLYEK